MSEYSRIMEGEFTSAGVAKFVQLPCLPRSFSIVNKTQYNSATQDDVKEAFSYKDEAAGSAYITYNGAASSVANKTLITSGGFEWITAGEPTFGAVVSASGANSVDKDGNPMEVNITSHGFQTGDVVWLYGTTGMLQISGVPFTVTVVNANQFTINVDTGTYTFAADATAVSAKKLLYADLYRPWMVMPTGISGAANAVVECNVNHGFVVGQRVKLHVPTGWGMVEADQKEATVLSVTADSFTCDLDTSGFTAFAWPASSVAGGGMNFPAAYSVGDKNFGYVFDGGSPLNRVLGAFVANTRQGVNVGLGGTQVMHTTSDVVHWRAELPDWYDA